MIQIHTGGLLFSKNLPKVSLKNSYFNSKTYDKNQLRITIDLTVKKSGSKRNGSGAISSIYRE